MPPTAVVISLSPLDSAFQNLTHFFSGMCCEAASFCLEMNAHESPAHMAITGDEAMTSQLQWAALPDTAAATYRDRDMAAENGAYTIAIAVLHHACRYRTVERAPKGDGFDFWMTNADSGLTFERSALLEVSGIFCGARRVTERLRRKLRQVRRSDLKARRIAVVAEFGTPTLSICQGVKP